MISPQKPRGLDPPGSEPLRDPFSGVKSLSWCERMNSPEPELRLRSRTSCRAKFQAARTKLRRIFRWSCVAADGEESELRSSTPTRSCRATNTPEGGGPGASEPRSLGAPEPRNPGASEPRSLGASEPRSPGAQQTEKHTDCSSWPTEGKPLSAAGLSQVWGARRLKREK